MSVVNKMLKDLDERAALDDVEGAEYAAPEENKRVKLMVSFIVAVLLMAGAYFTYRTMGAQYFIDLYHQVAVYLGQEQEQPKDTKKVKVNSALDQMMPTRSGANEPVSAVEPGQETGQDAGQAVSERESQPDSALPSVDAEPDDMLAREENQPEQSQITSGEALDPIVVASQQAQTDAAPTQSEPETITDAEPGMVVQVSGTGQDPQVQLATLKKQAAQAAYEGDVATAMGLYEQALGLDSNDHEVRKKLSVLYYTQNNNDKAKELLSDGVDMLPQRLDFRLMLARLYYREKNYFDAYSVLEDLDPDVENNIDYYGLKANVAKELEEFAEASHIYGRLALFEPNRAQWWLGLAVSLDKLGEREGALKAYENAADLRQLSASADDFIRQRILALGG